MGGRGRGGRGESGVCFDRDLHSALSVGGRGRGGGGVRCVM